MPAEIAKKMMLYRVPNMDAVRVRRGVEYQATERVAYSWTYTIRPTRQKNGLQSSSLCSVIPTSTCPCRSGASSGEMGMAVSVAQVLAASGMVAIIYEARNPVTDVDAVLSYLTAKTKRRWGLTRRESACGPPPGMFRWPYRYS